MRWKRILALIPISASVPVTLPMVLPTGEASKIPKSKSYILYSKNIIMKNYDTLWTSNLQVVMQERQVYDWADLSTTFEEIWPLIHLPIISVLNCSSIHAVYHSVLYCSSIATCIVGDNYVKVSA